MTDGVTLVTGATGFAGRHLLDRLGNATPVVAWHRSTSPQGAETAHLTWDNVDITDRAALVGAVERARPARIFHLAGGANVETSWQNAVLHLRTNALGTHHLLDAVRLVNPACRVLVVSSAQIYQPAEGPIGEDGPLCPSNPYGLSKLAQDQIALRVAADEHLDVVVARPFNHIGPRQAAGFAISNFARQIARIEAGLAPAELGVGNLESCRDITDVRDVVDAYVRLMEGGTAGTAYNVCSGRVWRMHDLLNELLKNSTAAIRVTSDPARIRPNDPHTVQGDSTRLRSELQWAPTIPVERTLRDTLDWWRQETAASRP